MTKRIGIVLLGGNGTRLKPLTLSTSKHLLPVYDKPMFYYPLATLMSAGISKIYLITNSSERVHFERHFGDGHKLGIELIYLVQEKPLGIANGLALVCDLEPKAKILLILGDNLFVGPGLGRNLKKYLDHDGAVIFAYRVPNPEDYGNVTFDKHMNAIDIKEKPESSTSPFAITGMYFLDENCSEYLKTLRPSKRGEYEITDLLKTYLATNRLKTNVLQRGLVWFDTGSIQNLFSAGEYMRVMQERQNLKYGVPEEISFRNGWISKEDLIEISNSMIESEYSQYIRNIPEIMMD